MSALKQTFEPSVDLATGEELLKLESQLEKLMTHNQQVLREENLLDDIERMLIWIDDCQNGSRQAERHLFEEGATLLTNIHEKLKLALEEELRIEDESPAAAALSKGRKAEQLSKANTRTNAALCTIEGMADGSCNHDAPQAVTTPKP